MNTIRQEKERAVNMLVAVENDLTVMRKDNSDFRLVVERKDQIMSNHIEEHSLVVERKNRLEGIVSGLETENDGLKSNITDAEGRLLYLQKEGDNANVEVSRYVIDASEPKLFCFSFPFLTHLDIQIK